MLAIVVALVTAAGPSDDIRIGVVASLGTPTGVAIVNGARLAVRDVNVRGVLGRRIVLVERDDRLDPAEGVRVVESLVRDGPVAAIVGPTRTIVAEAIAPVANRARIPLVIAGATGSSVNELFATTLDNYVFRFALSDSIQASLIAREAVEARGFRSPAILADDSGYGVQGRARLEAALRVRSVAPVAIGHFPLDLDDPVPLLEKVRASAPDVLLLFSHAKQLARVVRGLERLRWRVPIVGCWTLGQREFLDAAGPYAEGALMPRTLFEDAPATPEARRFVAAYRAVYGPAPMSEPSAAAQAYDAVQLLAAAIAQAGNDDGQRVKRALEDLRHVPASATGHHWHPFSPNDHDGLRRGDVTMGVVRGGRVRPAERRSRPRAAAGRRARAARPARTASRTAGSRPPRGTPARSA